VDVKWFGSACIELTYKDSAGRLGSELIYRDRESSLEIVTAGTRRRHCKRLKGY